MIKHNIIIDISYFKLSLPISISISNHKDEHNPVVTEALQLRPLQERSEDKNEQIVLQEEKSNFCQYSKFDLRIVYCIVFLHLHLLIPIFLVLTSQRTVFQTFNIKRFHCRPNITHLLETGDKKRAPISVSSISRNFKKLTRIKKFIKKN